jgi:hypothetical protein
MHLGGSIHSRLGPTRTTASDHALSSSAGPLVDSTGLLNSSHSRKAGLGHEATVGESLHSMVPDRPKTCRSGGRRTFPISGHCESGRDWQKGTACVYCFFFKSAGGGASFL